MGREEINILPLEKSDFILKKNTLRYFTITLVFHLIHVFVFCELSKCDLEGVLIIITTENAYSLIMSL